MLLHCGTTPGNRRAPAVTIAAAVVAGIVELTVVPDVKQFPVWSARASAQGTAAPNWESNHGLRAGQLIYLLPMSHALFLFILVTSGTLATADGAEAGHVAAPIDSAFGITLGERWAVDPASLAASPCARDIGETLFRCDIEPGAGFAYLDRLRVLVDDQLTVHGVEGHSLPLTPGRCEQLRDGLLNEYSLRFGPPVRVSFEAWGYDGALWEQELDHEFGTRALSLSVCRDDQTPPLAGVGAEAKFRLQISFGAEREINP